MLITEILARNARMYGEETALIERSPAENSRREITWTRFNDQSNRLARALADMGVQKGDKVIHHHRQTHEDNFFFVFRPSIIPAPKCTGSAISSWARKPLS